MKKIIAVDFDNTLALNSDIKKIGKPNKPLINKLIQAQNFGHKLILWTCRDGQVLKEAIQWCLDQGLEFDAVNVNLERVKHTWGSNLSVKVYADIYLDDRNLELDKFIRSNLGDL